MQRTTYSVSDSVNSVGSDDLNSGPRIENSGTLDSCSANEAENKVSLIAKIDLPF